MDMHSFHLIHTPKGVELNYLQSDGNFKIFLPRLQNQQLKTKKLQELKPEKQHLFKETIICWKPIYWHDQTHYLIVEESGHIEFFTSNFTSVWRQKLSKNIHDKHHNLYNETTLTHFIVKANIFISDFTCMQHTNDMNCGVAFISADLISSSSDNEGDKMLLEIEPLLILALNLNTGQIYWQHMSTTQSSNDNSQSIINNNDTKTENSNNNNHNHQLFHHWKLDLLNEVEKYEHVQALHWDEYRTDIMSSLPYVCDATSKYHTKMSVKQVGRGLPKKGNEYRIDVNSLFIGWQKGLLLMDLVSGKIRASLSWDCHEGMTMGALPIPGISSIRQPVVISLTSSLNTEQRVIECQAFFSKLDKDMHIGPDIVLKINDLCYPSNYFDYPRIPEEGWIEDKKKIVSPLVIPRMSQPGGFAGLFHHLFGHAYSPLDHSDYIFLMSDGIISSVSDNGLLNWKTNAQVSWIQLARHALINIDDELSQSYAQFKPSLNIAGFKTRDKPTLQTIIAVGWDSLSLIDPISGQVMATHSLPCPPIDSPTVDGHVIYVPCKHNIIGLHVHYASHWLFYLMLWIVLTALFLFLSWLCHPENQWFVEFTSYG